LKLIFLILILSLGLSAKEEKKASFLNLIPYSRIYKGACNNESMANHQFQVKSLELGNFIEISNMSEDPDFGDPLVQFEDPGEGNEYNHYKSNVHAYIESVEKISSDNKEITFKRFEFDSMGTEISMTDLVISEKILKFNYFNQKDFIMHFCSSRRI